MINWSSTFVKLRREISGRVQYRRQGPMTGPMRELPVHDHDLHYYYAGRGAMQVHGRTVELQRGVCLWLRPGGTYVSTQDPRARLGHCYLHFDLVSEAGRVLTVPPDQLPPAVLPSLRVPATEAIACWVADVAMENRAALLPAAEAALRALLMALCATQPASSPASDAAHPVVTSVVRMIEENLAAAPTIATLAQKSGYSQSSLLRLFRNELGMSPQQYVTDRRLALAKQLLRDSHRTVAQIAVQLGYDDPLYFSRLFHRHTGRSPSDFRAKP